MGRKLKDDPRQKSIDFSWCQRDAIIRDCHLHGLQDKHGDKVSMTTAKCVLSIINSHAGGREAWLSFETLAAKVGKKLRTVKRAVAALEGRGVLIVEYRRSQSGVPCNHYRIVWSELAILVPPPKVRTVPVSTEDSASFAEDSASSGTQSANAKKRSLEARGYALPDFSDLTLSDPWDVLEAIERLEGLRDDFYVARAAAYASRRGKVNPVGLFVTVITKGFDENLTEVDNEAAKRTLSIIGGLRNGPSQRQSDQRPHYDPEERPTASRASI